MPNEPTETLASNAMTTLEATMERLGIDPATADTTVKNNIIRLVNSASQWVETVTGRKFGEADLHPPLPRLRLAGACAPAIPHTQH